MALAKGHADSDANYKRGAAFIKPYPPWLKGDFIAVSGLVLRRSYGHVAMRGNGTVPLQGDGLLIQLRPKVAPVQEAVPPQGRGLETLVSQIA